MAADDLHLVVPRERVEVAARQMRKQSSRELHRAQTWRVAVHPRARRLHVDDGEVHGTQVHGSSRLTGHVMHRGPPPPRTSSDPSNVITARSASWMRDSPVRNATAGTT